MSIGGSMTGLFGKNPISHLRKHFDIAHDCSKQLTPFVAASTANDWEAAAAVQAEIVKLEALADDYKADLYLSLPKRLFTSIPREDLLQIVNLQDNVANTVKDIAGLMLGRKMQVPSPLTESFSHFLTTSLDTVAQAHLAIEELDDLMESGFGGHESKLLEKLIIKLDELEHKNDEAQVKVRSELFAIERELPPIDAMFLYRVIAHIGELADRAQTLGGQLMQLIAR